MKRLLLVALILLLFCLNVTAESLGESVIVTVEPETIYFGNADFIKNDVLISFENTSDNAIDLDLTFIQPNNFVVSPVNKTLTLNSHSTHSFSFNLRNVKEISNGTYFVGLSALLDNSNSYTINQLTKIVVSNNPIIELEFSGDSITVVKGKENIFSVIVDNSLSEATLASFNIQAPGLNARFEPSEILLTPNNDVNISFIVSPDVDFPEFETKAVIIVNAGNYSVRKLIEVNLINPPSPIPDNDYSVSLSKSVSDVVKGKSVIKTLTLVNNSNSDAKFVVTVHSKLYVKVSDRDLIVPANSSTKVDLNVIALPFVSAGTFDVNVFVQVKSKLFEKKTFVRVLPSVDFNVWVEPLIQEIFQSESKDFKLYIKNTGDLTKVFSLEFSSDSGINLTASNESLYLKPGEQSFISLSLKPSADHQKGVFSQQVDVIQGDLNRTVNFNYLVLPLTNFVSIESFPKIININPGETLSLPITILNDSNMALTNVILSFSNLPSNASIATQSITLHPRSVTVVEPNLIVLTDANNSSQTIYFTLSGTNFSLSESFELNIGVIEADDTEPIAATGLLGLFFSEGLGLLLGIIILLILIFLIVRKVFVKESYVTELKKEIS
ncbi:MAG: hypothetical protein ABH821_01925 [archaeon]